MKKHLIQIQIPNKRFVFGMVKYTSIKNKNDSKKTLNKQLYFIMKLFKLFLK